MNELLEGGWFKIGDKDGVPIMIRRELDYKIIEENRNHSERFEIEFDGCNSIVSVNRGTDTAKVLNDFIQWMVTRPVLKILEDFFGPPPMPLSDRMDNFGEN